MTILAGLAGRTALAGHRQACLYLECFRKSSAVGQLHPLTTYACIRGQSILLPICRLAERSEGGRSVGRAGGKGLGASKEKEGGEVRLDSILASISIIAPRASAVQGWWPCDDS